MRYENDGRYDSDLINEAKQEYCHDTGSDFPEQDSDPEFIDWLVERTISVATGRTVRRFLREAIKIKSQNGNIWKPFQIQCVLNTYTNIMTARQERRTG